MITFGGTIFVGYMFNMTVLPITKIVITRSIGVEGLPVFELAYRVSMQLRSIFQIALKALMPEISKLSSDPSQESSVKMEKIIAKANRLLLLGAIPLYTLVFLLAGLIFKIWLGADFMPSVPGVFRVMLLASCISLIGVIPYYILMGRGITKKILIHHIISAGCILLSVGSTVSLMPDIHIISISWCFVVGAVFGTGYLLLVRRETTKLF
jgi:O-antigen/teichoic acid export membrane protein